MLREPCPEHGRYDEHRFLSPGGDPESSIAYLDCPGGRSLTDAVLAERGWVRVWDECGCTVARMVDNVTPTGEQPADPDCPACAGTGRTLRDGAWRGPNPNAISFPASWLGGGVR